MKRLNYFDYVKTPESWKSKALDIPNQMKMVKSKRRYKPSAILVACITVISLSGIGVLAVESGSIDILKNYLSKNRYTPYSYSKTYNDTLDTSTLDEYFKTDVQVENLNISNDNIDFKVNGYLYDRNIAYIMAEIILPEGCTFTYDNIHNHIGDADIFCDNNEDYLGGLGIHFQSVQDNVLSAMITIYELPQSDNETYTISFSDLGSYDYDNNFIPQYEFDISFDITLKDCEISKSVDVNRNITLKDGITATLTSIDYSPLRINFNFDNIQFNPKDFEYYGTESKISKQFTMYYIYNDGRRVFIDRMGMLSNRLEDNSINQLFIDYAQMSRNLVDFTNIVAIEINGEVISLK